MKSKFVKTLLVSSLVATIATGCGDDKDNKVLPINRCDLWY